ncbi:hypothetical protein OJ996_20495 [Luteolibacter sp. GHJ8]|uniref:Uncharacterized protein n=1 Tax=Luteolibacter rhizosphaerae TaxID=2989719 RepID=A0ABT3G801_9BACT|nr:hypothetical protein [Luteolibacter rhizosphaerae]MCW1915979.1 hypothetical protein [Luteolibacter rhizosphaerae]
MSKNRWITLRCSAEIDDFQRDHPNAFLLLCQIARRARWDRKPCEISGLKFGEAFIGDFASAGLKSEKIYRGAKGAIKRSGYAAFRAATTGATKAADGRARRGTIATLLSTKIFKIAVEDKGGSKGDKKDERTGDTRGDIEGSQRATKQTDHNKDSTSSVDDGDGLPDEVEFWNTHPELPRVLSMNPGRWRKLRAIREVPEWPEGWRRAIGKLAASEFATGKRNGWKANFDFLIRPDKFAAILDGAYDDHAPRNPVRKPAGVSAAAFSLNTPVSVDDL